MEKEIRYKNLVDKFRSSSNSELFSDDNLHNPYLIDFSEKTLWSHHNKLNPWELWHGNLNADILFIGQDFSDKDYFIENFKSNWDKERKSPTNRSLSDLFSLLGYNIGLPGDTLDNALPLLFTNAVLGIKQNGMAGAIKTSWYSKTAKEFTKELIDIVNPKSVIVMGKHAYNMICKAYNLNPNDNFTEAINNNGNYFIDGKQLFVVAHCSGLGKRNRSFIQQKEDWQKIKEHLSH